MKTNTNIFADRRVSNDTIKSDDNKQLSFKDRRNPYNAFNNESWYLRVNYVRYESKR